MYTKFHHPFTVLQFIFMFKIFAGKVNHNRRVPTGHHPHLEYLLSCRIQIGPINIDPADALPLTLAFTRPWNLEFVYPQIVKQLYIYVVIKKYLRSGTSQSVAVLPLGDLI
jgi:hypothetical protein